MNQKDFDQHFPTCCNCGRALGFFVDTYDLLLFAIIRKAKPGLTWD